MDVGQRPQPQALAIGVIITLAVTLSFYVNTHLGEHYARHGDRMD